MLVLVLVLVLVLGFGFGFVLGFQRDSQGSFSITSTSTVRQGGLGTSTKKQHEGTAGNDARGVFLTTEYTKHTE